MNIIGAGLTGCLAGYVFKNAVIKEYLEKPKEHKAVLRFRSDWASKLTGIPFKKVKVYKGIYMDGEHVQPSIDLMNQYSCKVTGGYYDRSISNLEPVTRWIAPSDFHGQMLDDLNDRIIYGYNVDVSDCSKPLISTLPLPILLDRLGIEFDFKSPDGNKSKSIFVTTCKIANCDVYQTMYYPGYDTSVYRASITGDNLIIESTALICQRTITMVAYSFGLYVQDCKVETLNFEQEHGKFIPLEEEQRKQLMYDITKDYNIYSLGRHATWRKILLDDVIQDCTRIEKMISKSAYDLMVGK